MSTAARVTRKCSVCGKESEHRVLMSSNTFGGGPDLDTRPAEMMRSTMCYWVQECPHCGYISEDISDETSVGKEYLDSEEYIKCNNLKLPTDLANKFYKYYLLNIKDENPKDAFLAALHTAWICDDKSDEINACNCRLLALEQLEILLQEEPSEMALVVKADLLRRTGQFNQLINEYENKQFDDKLLNKIVDFEILKAKEADTSCYRVEDVESQQ